MRRSSFSSSSFSSSSESSSFLHPFSISISDTLDGGNGKLVAVTQNPSEADVINVILNIQPDVYTELEQMCHMQYFFFRATLSRNHAYNAHHRHHHHHHHSQHSIAEHDEQDEYDDHDACNGTNDTNDNNIQQKTVQRVCYILDNAEKASYPEAWTGTTVCYSTRPSQVDSWKRCVDTEYRNGKLSWTFEHDLIHRGEYSVYFAFFPPFSYERHLSLVAQCASASAASSSSSLAAAVAKKDSMAAANVQVYSLGQTLQGREMDCIQVGTGSTVCWIIHRQHPGETMAEHYAEGLLTRLLQLDDDDKTSRGDDHSKHEDDNDETRRKVLSLYTFYIIPCMCPDGAVLGHLRTNAVGANLNREWAPRGHYQAPTMQRSPEVHCVLTKMQQTGVDMFLDVHGDEELPYNFMAGAQMVPHWSPRLQALHGAFLASYTRATNGTMQRRIGYPPAENLAEAIPYMNVATNQISNRFECLGLTLEMPFKDCRSNPEPEVGWTPRKCRALGAAVLEPLLYIHPHLRAGCGGDKNADDDNAKIIDWATRFGPHDAYIKPTDDYQSEPGFERQEGEFIRLHRRFYSDVHESNKPAS
jgi:murein tripeptide amidase MpaA